MGGAARPTLSGARGGAGGEGTTTGGGGVISSERPSFSVTHKGRGRIMGLVEWG